MSEILILSFDCPSSPSIILKNPQNAELAQKSSYGRGFAWYNQEEPEAIVIKEAKYTDTYLFNIMQDFSKFYSTIFIGHIRGAAKRLSQQDTQPFMRSYAGRNWVFVHSGDLQANYPQFLPLKSDMLFEPVGSTDSEHMFCYLLEKIVAEKARSLAEIGYEKILEWLKEINQLGTINIALSDGIDILVYNDLNNFNPLYWLRSCPLHLQTRFDSKVFSLEITSPFDTAHTFAMVANEKLNELCQGFIAGQMLVLRRGQVIWNSQANAIQAEEENIAVVEIPVARTEVSQRVIDHVQDAEPKFLSIEHETIYRYDAPVEISKHLFHLHPINDHIQNVVEYKLGISVEGEGGFFEDVFGNIATYYNINSKYDELIISSSAIISVIDNPNHQSEYLHQRREIPLSWLPWQRQMMSPYLLPMELPESELNELIKFAMSFVKRNDYDLMNVLIDINNTIYRDFKYVPGATSITATPYDLYIKRAGVCQDFANLFICLARLLNIPARYRTGYVYVGEDIENKIQSEASHAWVECYLPYIGWYGFDPTNGNIAEKNHIRIACGRNYLDASPTTGTIYKGGGDEELEVKVKVRVLKNYQNKHSA